MGTSSPRLGPFLLQRVIGRGGYATVWEAVHRTQDVPVAVKVLRPEGVRDARFVSALQREGRLVAGLDHPNIVALLDQGVVPDAPYPEEIAVGSPYLVMELGRHGTLAEQVGQLGWSDVQQVLDGLLAGLAHAHARGIVHRDLKPSNVLWGPTPADVRLVDLGIATAEQTGVTRGVFGTPTFMAPEQLVTVGWRVGPWTDLFGLGVIAWALLTRALPWSDSSITEARASRARPLPPLEPRIRVPDGVVEWVLRLLEPDPADRPGSAAEARQALQRVAGRGSISPRERPRQGRPRTLLVGAGLSLVRLREAALVGREAVCESLWTRLGQAVARPRCQAVVLRGPSGVGKSRLARWLVRAAHESFGATLLEATHSAIPGPEDGLVHAVRRRLRAEGPAAVSHGAWWLDRLGDAPLPSELIDRLLQAGRAPAGPLGEVLTALALRRPTLVHLDDVQWGPDALAWLSPLLGQDLPLLPVITVQDEAVGDLDGFRSRLDAFCSHPDVHLYRLDTLSTEAGVELARGLTAVDMSLAVRLQERSAGNPLHAVQLLMDWVDRGVVEPSPTGLRMVADGDPGLDGDLVQLWERRLDRHLLRYPAAAQEALELAAVLGREVSRDDWVALCMRAALDVPTRLVRDLAASAMILGDPESRWSWSHGILREALFKLAREGGRLRRHHQRVADWLAETAAEADADDGRVERRARHLLAAGQDRAALPLLLEAATAANRTGRQGAAIALLHDQVATALRLGLPPSAPEVVRARILGTKTAFNERRLEEAISLGEDAILRARMGGSPELLVDALSALAGPLSMAGRREEARSVLAEASARAASLGDREQVALVEIELAELMLEGGEVEQARRTATALLDDTSLDERTRVVVHDTLSRIAIRQRDPDAVLRHAHAIRAFAERTGRRSWVAHTWNLEGEVARMRGDLLRARTCYEEAVRRLRAIGARADTALLNLVVVDLLEGRADQARASLDHLAAEASRRRATLAGNHLHSALRCWACVQLRDVDGAWRGVRELQDVSFAGAHGADLRVMIEHAQEAAAFLGDANLEEALDAVLVAGARA